MQNARTLGILILALLVGAAAYWAFAGSSATVSPDAGAADRQGAGADAAAPEAAGGPGAEAAEGANAGATSRVEAAMAPVVAAGPAVTGQVVDAGGVPVAGAVVGTWAGFGTGIGPDAGAFDGGFPDELPDFDPAALAERVRGAAAARTEVTTDADGRFRLAAAGEGRTMFLRVRARGHRLLDRTTPRPTKEDADLGVLTLQTGAVVSGRVVDAGGTGIADARVQREAAGEAPREWFGEFEMPGGDVFAEMSGQGAVTDAEGRFELPHCEPGTFALRARHPAHPQARLDGLSVAPSGVLTDVLVTMERGATISGRVTGSPEGARSLRAIAAAVVQEQAPREQEGFAALIGDGAGDLMADFGGFGERSAEIGADGKFVITGLHPGRRYRVWAWQGGLGIVGSGVCSQRLEIPAPTEGIELRYDAGVTVRCQFVDATSGAPVDQLWVRDALRGSGGIEDLAAMVPRGGGRSRSYPEGRVTLASLRPKEKQKLDLTVEAVGFRTFERKSITLPLAGEMDLGVVRLERAPVVRVLVREAGGGPIAGATVRANAQDAPTERSDRPWEMWGARLQRASGPLSARSDAEGRCVVNIPAGNTIVVEVTDKEHAPHVSKPLSLSPADGGDYTADLVIGGTIEVTAVDQAGKPLADRRIEHAADKGARGGRATNREGVATFDHVAPGVHQFRLGRRDGAQQFAMLMAEVAANSPTPANADEGWQTVEVPDRGRATLRLVEDPKATLHGIVRQNGAPLVGARMTFLSGPASTGGFEDLSGMMEEFGRGAGGGRGRSGRTGDDGSYELKDLPAGSHRLRVTSSDRAMPAVIAVTLQTGENVYDVDLDVAIVSGVVRDPDGKPVSGASISVVPVRDRAAGQGADVAAAVDQAMPGGLEMLGGGGGRGRSVKTTDDGAFELRGLQTDVRLQVRASAKGFAAVLSEPFQLAPGGVQSGVDLRLLASGRIRVTMADSVAFASARAQLLDAAGEVVPGVPPVMQILRRGAGTLDGLRPGRWRVEILLPGGDPRDPRTIDVIAGETATAAF